MKPRHFTRLRTDFDVAECRRRLFESIDLERRTIFSLSGYKGSKQIIGSIEASHLFLHKRRYWHNDFAPQFNGTLFPEGRGSIIEGCFDVPRWTRAFMRIWLAMVVAIGGPIFVLTVLQILQGRRYVEGDTLVGLLVPPGLVLFGLLLPRLGLWLGRNEEEFILEFLQKTIVGRIERTSLQVS